DELVTPRLTRSTFATTLNASPARVWPWLVQMGCDRGGFYSWDRLDNGGRASADRVHPEWQGLAAGDRVRSVPDGSVWFEVAALEPERALVLRAHLTLRGRPFDPDGEPPRAFSDSTWGFFLRPAPGGGTRLVVRSNGGGRPRALIGAGSWLFWDLAHWIMQTKQLAELRRRVETAGQ
ncbi:MAG: hypothetical protein JWQ48_675, partial [Conexibacter sp.]|nr:hypothetical protein [Conexibacter sp.]